MKSYKFNTIICCSFDLTLATRIIGFIGLAVSALLVTVLLNDKSINDYEVSRNLALALGLDWRHFHPHANTTHHADPDGKMISIIVLFYAVMFLVTNIFLLFAATLNKRILTIPWLVCEFLGCLSKLGAMIFHLVNEPEKVNNIFVIGSGIYIVTVAWWWIVVFEAQSQWSRSKKVILHLSTTNELFSVLDDRKDSEQLFQGEYVHLDSFNSPVPYSPNATYKVIK